MRFFSVTHTFAFKLKVVCLVLGFVLSVMIFPRLFVSANSNAVSADVRTEGQNQFPELMPLRHKRVGIGQRIFFGLGTIDEEGDEVRVELIQKPASANYNEKTLTVDWTPAMKELGVGRFVIKVTELPRDKLRPTRSKNFTYEIPVQRGPVAKLLEIEPTTMEVDTLVSIVDPLRLKAANERWNIIQLFQRIAEIEADKQITQTNGIQPTTGETLFRDMLKNMAALHRNEAIDPDSSKYNPVWDAKNWRLTGVRPRLNKKTFELRLIYFNVVAAEPVYLMPRMRIVRGKDAGRPEELRQKNNKEFARLFYEAFFDGADLKPFVAKNKLKYGEALADFMTKVLTYNDPTDPRMKANLAAIPHNSRLGGDNEYDEKGNYLSGDGWALGALKVGPIDRSGKKVLAFISPFIDGFASSIKPNAEGTAYKPVPAPRFNPDSDSFAKGWDHLIDDDDKGNIAIADVQPDNTVKRSNIDSSSVSWEHKFKFMVEETPLRDPRRRLFEERGMTCIQCHVRNFDEGDYLKSVYEPKNDVKAVWTRTIPRVFFVILPTLFEGRSEYIRREEYEQVGNLRGVIRDYLGVKVNIKTPLTDNDWPHDTRHGRS
jgi:hypothetical protein